MWRFDPEMNPGTWEAVRSPVSTTLHDVARTANGLCAVGKRGRVLGRSPDGKWGVIVEDGPSARGETLYCAAATDDGERVWFAGANGALGCYDLQGHARTDFSEPMGIDNAFHGIAVAGERGREKLLVSDGSGHTIPGKIESGTADWDHRRKPAGGTALTAICSDRNGIGYGVDGNGNVWQTTTEGWHRIGVADAQNSFYAASATTDAIVVGGGNGRIYELRHPDRPQNPDVPQWTPYAIGSFTVESLAQHGKRLLAGGTNGKLYVRRTGRDWTSAKWSGSKSILGVAIGSPSVGVGKNGTIVECVSRDER